MLINLSKYEAKVTPIRRSNIEFSPQNLPKQFLTKVLISEGRTITNKMYHNVICNSHPSINKAYMHSRTK